jgi:hypothetical protein
MRSRHAVALVALALGLAAGCNPAGSSDSGGTGGGAPDALVEGRKFLLDREPDAARGVREVKKQAKDGDEVVVVGRVGGSGKPFVEGRGSFLIVDPELKPAAECDCPWDYCETPRKQLAAARAVVRFLDGKGRTLQAGAREVFDIKELSTVVVRGKARVDEKGNLTVLGSGLYVRQK